MQFDSYIMSIYQPSIRSFPTGEYDLHRQGLFPGFIEPEVESLLWNEPTERLFSPIADLSLLD